MSIIDLFNIPENYGGGDAGQPDDKKGLLNGYLDEVRFTKGRRYTPGEDFTLSSKSAVDNCAPNPQVPCEINCTDYRPTIEASLLEWSPDKSLPYTSSGPLRFGPTLKKDETFSIRVGKRSELISAEVLPGAGGPNSDGAGGIGDGAVQLTFSLAETPAVPGFRPPGVEAVISYCPGDFDNPAVSDRCKSVSQNIVGAHPLHVLYATPGWDQSTIFTRSGQSGTIDTLQRDACVVDPERDFYLNLRWTNIDDDRGYGGTHVSIGFNQGKLPVVTNPGCFKEPEPCQVQVIDCNPPAGTIIVQYPATPEQMNSGQPYTNLNNRWGPGLTPSETFSIKIPKKADLIALGVDPGPGSPNSDGAGGTSGDGIAALYFSYGPYSGISWGGPQPPYVEFCFSYCPGDFTDYIPKPIREVPNYERLGACKGETINTYYSIDFMYGSPGWDETTIFNVSGSSGTWENFSRYCVVDPDRDVYLNIRWKDISPPVMLPDVKSGTHDINIGFIQGKLPKITSTAAGCGPSTQGGEFQIVCEKNPTTSVLDRLNYNFPGHEVPEFSDSVMKTLQAIPPVLPRWAYTDLQNNNVGSYIKNPVAKVVNEIANKLLSIKKSATSLNLNSLRITSNTAYTNTILFLQHTNRLSGLVEPNENTFYLPHYETAISTGKIVTNIVYQADGKANAATMMGSFTSIMVEKELQNLKNTIINFSDTSRAISNIRAIQSFMDQRRIHDEKFYLNSTCVAQDFGQLQRFARMGSTETILMNDYLATDKLKERGYTGNSSGGNNPIITSPSLFCRPGPHRLIDLGQPVQFGEPGSTKTMVTRFTEFDVWSYRIPKLSEVTTEVVSIFFNLTIPVSGVRAPDTMDYCISQCPGNFENPILDAQGNPALYLEYGGFFVHRLTFDTQKDNPIFQGDTFIDSKKDHYINFRWPKSTLGDQAVDFVGFWIDLFYNTEEGGGGTGFV